MRGVPLAGEAFYCAGPVTRTRQVASSTRSMMSVRSVGGVTSAGGGPNSTLANALLTAQLMFCEIESVARMNAGAAAVATTTPITSPGVPDPEVELRVGVSLFSTNTQSVDLRRLRLRTDRERDQDGDGGQLTEPIHRWCTDRPLENVSSIWMCSS